jgi:predicted alpha/beta-hydrolase family hydrolase
MRGLALGFVLTGAVALAEEPKVLVMADVILASNEGTVIDPPSLASVKDEFASTGFTFTSYKRLSSEQVSLTKAKPATLKLPNQKTATLKLEDIKDGTASVKVNAGGAQVGVQLGRQGKVFVRAGAHQNGQLVLMLSPGAEKKPRRGPVAERPAR